MSKKILALILCVLSALCMLSGCAKDEKEEVKDWSKAYDTYVENLSLTDGVKIITEFDESGMQGDVSVSFFEGKTYACLDFKTVQIDLFMDEAYLYFHYVADGQEDWLKAKWDNSNDIIDLTGMQYPLNKMIKSIVNVTYFEETNIDDVIYDVLLADVPWGTDNVRYYINKEGVAVGLAQGTTIVSEDGTEISYDALPEYAKAKLYVNRETQELAKFEGYVEGYYIEYNVEKIEILEIPDKALSAPEVSDEEMATTMLGIIFIAMSEVNE